LTVEIPTVECFPTPQKTINGYNSLIYGIVLAYGFGTNIAFIFQVAKDAQKK